MIPKIEGKIAIKGIRGIKTGNRAQRNLKFKRLQNKNMISSEREGKSKSNRDSFNGKRQENL